MSIVNPYQEIKIAKLCLNLNISPKTEKLDNAITVLKQISGQTPFTSKSRLTIRGWGIRRNEKISASVTIRGEKATELLDNALRFKEYELPSTCFSKTGSFGFGLEEHIDLGLKYDPSIGIFGLNYYVVLERAGTRVSKRRRCQSKVGNKQKISDEEARDWFIKKFDGIIKKQ